MNGVEEVLCWTDKLYLISINEEINKKLNFINEDQI